MKHMVNKAAMALLALAWGCGGDGPKDDSPIDGVCPAESDHPDCVAPSDAGDDEVGALEQPIIIHGEHGTTQAMGPCTHPFPGGTCYVPDHKANIIGWHAYSCNNTRGGQNGAWWFQAVERAVNDARDYLRARGWPTEVIKYTSAPALPGGNMWVKCEYGSGTIGVTRINEFGGTPFDCHDTPHGDLCQYNAGTMVVRPDTAVSTPMWSQTTSAQRSNMIYNVALHEILHFAGLPHRAHDPNNMNIMMPAIQAWLSPQWTTRMVPDVNQSLALYCYVNTSSTTPIVGCPASATSAFGAGEAAEAEDVSFEGAGS